MTTDTPDTASDSMSDSMDTARRDIALRAKRRALRDREYQICALATAAWAYSIFVTVMHAIGLVADQRWLIGILHLVIAAGLGYSIGQVWRTHRWNVWRCAAPVVVFIVADIALGHAGENPLTFSIVALVSLEYLNRIHRQLSELTPVTAS